jgi:hypothetical protein
MFRKAKNGREGLFKGIAAAYIILLLHLALIAGLGLVVVFLTGVANYLSWILLGGIGMIALSAYLFFRKLRKEGRTLGETLRSSQFRDREVEVSLLGGMATMRLGRPTERKPLPANGAAQPPQLEDPQSIHIRDIQALADLLEKNLITQEEFDRAKSRLFQQSNLS